MDNQKTFWLVLAAVVIIFFVFFASGNYSPSPQPQAALYPLPTLSTEAQELVSNFQQNCSPNKEPICAFYDDGRFLCGCNETPVTSPGGGSSGSINCTPGQPCPVPPPGGPRPTPICSQSSKVFGSYSDQTAASVAVFMAYGKGMIAQDSDPYTPPTIYYSTERCGIENTQFTDLNDNPYTIASCGCYLLNAIADVALNSLKYTNINNPGYSCFETNFTPFLVSPYQGYEYWYLHVSSDVTIQPSCPVTVPPDDGGGDDDGDIPPGDGSNLTPEMLELWMKIQILRNQLNSLIEQLINLLTIQSQ